MIINILLAGIGIATVTYLFFNKYAHKQCVNYAN